MRSVSASYGRTTSAGWEGGAFRESRGSCVWGWLGPWAARTRCRQVYSCFWGQPAVPDPYRCKLLWPTARAIQQPARFSCGFTLLKKIAGNGFQLVEILHTAYKAFCCSRKARYLPPAQSCDSGEVLSIWLTVMLLCFVHMLICWGGTLIRSFGQIHPIGFRILTSF